MNKNSKLWIVLKGIIAENPVLVLVLGTCPVLAVSTSIVSAISMGIAATLVLICSNTIISLLRKINSFYIKMSFQLLFLKVMKFM